MSPAGIAGDFESREFSSDELGAIKKTRRGSPRLGEATFTLDEELAERARQLKVNISAAAREGVLAAVKRAMGEADRALYERLPERPDDFWDDAEAWGAE